MTDTPGTEPSADEAWMNRPIGLDLPTKRYSAFNVLHASTRPTANPYLAAEQRQQASYRAALEKETATTRTCERCTAVMLPEATVCTSCCAQTDPSLGVPTRPFAAPVVAATPATTFVPAQAEPAVAAAPAASAGYDDDALGGASRIAVLTQWPFGPADPEISHAEQAAHYMCGIPAQRPGSSLPAERPRR